MDFRFLLALSDISCRVLLKQSGIVARIEGVVSGSNRMVLELSCVVRNANQILVHPDP